MDHVRFHPTCLEPPRQPEAVAAGFKGKRNPRDRAPSPDHLIPPAMQHCKQPFWARLELLARLTLNPGKHAGNEPARLAHLEDGNDRAILVQGDEGPAQVVRLGHRGTPSLDAATKLPFLAARPIESRGPTEEARHPRRCRMTFAPTTSCSGNEAEATSGGLETLVASCGTRARIRLPPRPTWCEPDFLIMLGAEASACRSSLATTRLGFLQLCA